MTNRSSVQRVRLSIPFWGDSYAQKIVKHNWSVRETERRIKHAAQNTLTTSKQVPRQNDPNIRAAETKLRRHLGTQVQIVPARAGSAGKIEIEYYSSLDLDRLYTLIISDRESDRPNAATASNGL